MNCNLPGSSVHWLFWQEYWSGQSFPSPWDLPYPGSNSGLLHCRQILNCVSRQRSQVHNEPLAIPHYMRASSHLSASISRYLPPVSCASQYPSYSGFQSSNLICDLNSDCLRRVVVFQFVQSFPSSDNFQSLFSLNQKVEVCCDSSCDLIWSAPWFPMVLYTSLVLESNIIQDFF